MSVLAGHRIVVIDLETTGWNAAEDDVLEIARVTIQDGAIADCWSTLISPGRPIPVDATRVHGIGAAALTGAPPAGPVARELRGSLEGAVLSAHHAAFDLEFLKVLFRRHGAAPLRRPVVDTLGLARGLFGSGGNELAALAERHGIAHDGPHRALPDARATAALLLQLAPRWERERGVRSLAELAGASLDALRLTGRRDL